MSDITLSSPSPLTLLPSEILVNIINFIPDRDLINFFSTCKTFNNINDILQSKFWLNRGLTVLQLNPDKVMFNLISEESRTTKFKYQNISFEFRRFTNCINNKLDNEVLFYSYRSVKHILQYIRINDPTGFCNFISNATYFMKSWIQFIVNELKFNYGKSDYTIRDLLCFPLSFEHVRDKNILYNIIEGISGRDFSLYEDIIEKFFDNMIVMNRIQRISIWMILIRYYFENRSGPGQVFLYKVFHLPFDRNMISNCVWNHLYTWNPVNEYAEVVAFLLRLKRSNNVGFTDLMEADSGMKIKGNMVKLSDMFHQSEYCRLQGT